MESLVLNYRYGFLQSIYNRKFISLRYSFFIIASQKCVPLAKIIDNGDKKSVFFLKKNEYQFRGNYNCMYKIEYVKHVFKPYHIKLL